MDNPLLTPSDLPYAALPFDKIQAGDYVPAMTEAVTQAQRSIEKIKNNPEPPSFANTIETLSAAMEDVNIISNTAIMVYLADGNNAFAAIQENVIGQLAAFQSAVYTDPVLFSRVDTLARQANSLNLGAEQKQLLQLFHRQFAENGVGLDKAGQEKLKSIDQDLVRWTTQYSQNFQVRYGKWQKIVDDEKDLAGLSTEQKEAYRQAAEAAGYPGKYLLTLRDAGTICNTAENRALRRDMYKAEAAAGFLDGHDNMATAAQILRLRNEKAKLLGYPDYVSYALADSGIATPSDAQAYTLTRLAEVKPEADQEIARLQAFAKQKDGIDKIEPWDVSYYAGKVKQAAFSGDQELKDYAITLEDTRQAMFAMAEKTFGIAFQKTEADIPVYNKDVQTFDVIDQQTGKKIGLYYFDPLARDDKKAGFSAAFRNKGLHQGKERGGLVLSCLSVQRAADGAPTTLPLTQAKDIMHEFGHDINMLVAQSRYPLLTDVNAGQELAEYYSQLIEYRSIQDDVLCKITRNMKTNEPLPPHLAKQMRDKEMFMFANETRRRLFVSLMDIRLHQETPQSFEAMRSIEKEVMAQTGQLYDPSVSRIIRLPVFEAGSDTAGRFFRYEVTRGLAEQTIKSIAGKEETPHVKETLRHLYADRGPQLVPELSAFIEAPEPTNAPSAPLSAKAVGTRLQKQAKGLGM